MYSRNCVIATDVLLSCYRAYGHFLILFVVRYVSVLLPAALLYSVFFYCLPVNGFTDTDKVLNHLCAGDLKDPVLVLH